MTITSSVGDTYAARTWPANHFVLTVDRNASSLLSASCDRADRLEDDTRRNPDPALSQFKAAGRTKLAVEHRESFEIVMQPHATHSQPERL